MPPGATANLPPCFLCQRQSHLPPAKMGWISASGEERLFLVCGTCADRSDGAELEQRIAEQVSKRESVIAA